MTAFIPPRVPACSPFTARDASPAASSSFAPTSPSWRTGLASDAVPGAILALAALATGAACVGVVVATRRRLRKAARVQGESRRARLGLRAAAALLALGVAAACAAGIAVTTAHVESGVDAWWEAASKAQEAAATALGDADAAVAAARSVEYGLRALAAAAPSLNGVDIAADATAAADAARDAADAGGAAAARVRTRGTDRVAAARAAAEPRSRRVARTAAAATLAATLGVIAVTALATGGVAAADHAAPAVGATAAAICFVGAAVALAVGVGGGAAARRASQDACLYAETAAVREAGAAGGPTAARAAAFYLDAAPPPSANASSLAALGLDPTALRSLLDNPQASAALDFVRSPAGAKAVARAGLPRDDRRRLLGLPAATDALKSGLASLETAAAPAAFAPAVLQAKGVPCCAAPAAAAAFSVAYAVAGGLALALAAVTCVLAATSPPRGRGKADGAEGGVVEIAAVG